MERAIAKLELIHTDISGSITPASAGGTGYWLTLTDDFTWSSWAYFLKKKGEALAKLEDFVTWIERQTDYKVKRLQFDNSGEYDNKKAKDWLKVVGI